MPFPPDRLNKENATLFNNFLMMPVPGAYRLHQSVEEFPPTDLSAKPVALTRPRGALSDHGVPQWENGFTA
jgi:hypothetical protein